MEFEQGWLQEPEVWCCRALALVGDAYGGCRPAMLLVLDVLGEV